MKTLPSGIWDPAIENKLRAEKKETKKRDRCAKGFIIAALDYEYTYSN